MNERRRPISLSGLRGFLAAARRQSFTRAAEDLNLTQSALSRQVQGLEDEVGTPLFVRQTRHLQLTPAGVALHDAASVALERIDACVETLRRPVAAPRIAVSTFASFASLWLIPRLAEFADMHPQTDVICAASDRLVDLDADGFDLALRCTDRDLAAEGHLSLFSEVTIPVCSPAFAAAHAPLSDPRELAQHTLLGPVEDIERRFPWMGWPHWFAGAGLARLRGRSALRFSNHDQAVQAALAGQGVALARGALIVDQLRAGMLIPLFAGRYPTAHRYWLVTTPAARERPAVMDFITWIDRQAQRTRQQMAELGLSID